MFDTGITVKHSHFRLEFFPKHFKQIHSYQHCIVKHVSLNFSLFLQNSTIFKKILPLGWTIKNRKSIRPRTKFAY